MSGELPHEGARVVVVGGAGASDELVEALVEDGVEASRRSLTIDLAPEGGTDRPGQGGTPDAVVVDLRGEVPTTEQVRAGLGPWDRPPAVVAVVPPDAPAAADRARALGATTVLVDEGGDHDRLPALIRATLPRAGSQLSALLDSLAALRARAVRDADELHLARVGLAALVDAVDLPAALLLRRADDGEDGLVVVAGAGALADVAVGAHVDLVTVDGAPAAGVAVSVSAAAVRDGEHRRELPTPALLVGVSGSELAGVLVAAEAEGDRAAEAVDVARSVTALLDQELARARAEVELRERVKELDALRQVQVAVQQRPPRAELRFRVAAAMVSGMRHRHAARAELLLDGERTAAGVDGPLAISIGADVQVDGVTRGELCVGYVEEFPLADPEELNLLDAIAETLSSYLSREAARSSLVVSEMRQRRVLDGLPTGVWTIDADGVVHVVSGGGFDAPAGGGPGTSFALGTWEDPHASWLRAAAQRAFAGDHVRQRLTVDERHLDVRLEPMPGPAGAVEEVLCLADDITVAHRAHELEARLASLVRNAHLGIVALELDGTIASWNRGAEGLFGWASDEVVGRHIGMLDTNDPSEPMLVPTGDGVWRIDEPYLETRRRHRDGREVEVGVSLATITAEDGTVLGASAIYHDLSERNQARRAREASELQFQLLADHAHDVVYRYRLTPEPGFEYVSPSVQTVLGFPASTLFDDPAAVLARFHPADRDRAALSTPGAVDGSRTRLRFQHTDGRWRWLEDRRTTIAVDGRPVALTGIARDVTDEQRSAEAMRVALARERSAAAQLRRVDDMKTAFLSAVSHELRTPLTSVIGFAETTARLLEDEPLEPDVDEMLERLLRNARRLEGLVSDLLDVDRLAKGDIEPRRTPTDLAELVRRAVKRNGSRDHRFVTDLDELTVDIDPMMVDRAIDNLVRNAVRHTPSGTTVWVRSERRTDEAVVVIEDDGPGVPAELHRRIFEPFQQGPVAQGAASPGTGIGLSLVQRFVEVHGGTVTLAERDGGGARFRVSFPDAG